MKRRDLEGNLIEGAVFTATCGDCGMPLLDAREFHPYEACVVFKRTHDSNEIWAKHGSKYLLGVIPPRAEDSQSRSAGE